MSSNATAPTSSSTDFGVLISLNRLKQPAAAPAFVTPSSRLPANVIQVSCSRDWIMYRRCTRAETLASCVFPASRHTPMFSKIFRKQSSTDHRPRFEQDAILAEELARRVSEIQFRPTKGFLKDQSQPKRSAPTPAWSRK